MLLRRYTLYNLGSENAVASKGREAGITGFRHALTRYGKVVARELYALHKGADVHYILIVVPGIWELLSHVDYND